MLGEKMKKLIIVIDDTTKTYGELLSALLSLKDDNENAVVGVKDGTVEAVVWDGKTYLNNESQLSSTNKVVFIGKNNVSTPVLSNIDLGNNFSQYGINIGSLGNKAVIYVDRRAINTTDLYKQFLTDYADFISKYKTGLIASQNVESVNLNGMEEIKEKREAVTNTLNTMVGRGVKGINKGLANIQKASAKMKGSDSVDVEIECESSVISDEAVGKTQSLISKAMKIATSNKAAENIAFDIINAKAGKEILDQQYRCAVISFYVYDLATFME